GAGAPDAHPPGLRALLQVLPAERAGVFGGELVVQRLGVVVVDQDEAVPSAERVVGLEDQLVAAGGDLGSYVQLPVLGHGRRLLYVAGSALWSLRSCLRCGYAARCAGALGPTLFLPNDS